MASRRGRSAVAEDGLGAELRGAAAMEIDDMVGVARACARAIHGERALLAVEENSEVYPPGKRWRASVKLRGGVVEVKYAATHGGALRELTRDLASRARQTMAAYQDMEFRAGLLGL